MKAPPERLGSFYLGSFYDLIKGNVTGESVNYDARDLTTHAICLGMTGSGKTGLCVCLLEEAAIDKVPAIVIDPKGDITNLLLHFPELRPIDFLEWVNPDDARRKGLLREDYATQVADTWRNGLEEWGINGERIKLLDETVDFTIYTPGSGSGVPVNILSSLKAPQIGDSEALNDLIIGTVNALLELANIRADAIRSREGILLSTIFDYYWNSNQDVTLERLIKDIITPPFSRVGVFEIETFYPQKERQELALALNALIASPGFSEWLTGKPLEIADIMYSDSGKPRHSVFYLAHLSEEEKMFFVTLLLERISTWMQRQSGTTSLRAIIYFDELFGFMPPVANPPSKTPLLRLLKQARAFGLGLVLVTQNPVDLDYKGLTNTGTWFIGKLQTERDKQRVLEGLTSAVADAGNIKVEDYNNIIGSLTNRVFLLHNVHSEEPTVFHTRWAMNYLRGPLTRMQIQSLMSSKVTTISKSQEPQVERFEEHHESPPHVDPKIEQLYLSTSGDFESERSFRKDHPGAVIRTIKKVFSPMLLANYSVRFYDRSRSIDKSKAGWIGAQIPKGVTSVDWSQMLKVEPSKLSSSPPEGVLFTDIPESTNTVDELDEHRRRLYDYLYSNSSLTIYVHKGLRISQGQDESQKEFISRVNQAARERRDDEIDKLKSKYETKLDRIEAKIRKLRDSLSGDEAEYEARKREEVLGIGETVVGILLGSRRTTGITTASRRRRMTTKAKQDIEETKSDIEALNKDSKELEDELREQVDQITDKWNRSEENIEEHNITPRKSDVKVDDLRILWVPTYIYQYSEGGVTKEQMIRTNLS
jgi:hypothetical protein